MTQEGKDRRRLNSRGFATALGEGHDASLGGTGVGGEGTSQPAGRARASGGAESKATLG